MLKGDGERAASAAPGRSRLQRALRVEWLGQTAASLCWIASMLTYGISSTGDWLQVMAASAWLIANLAAIATAETD
ncbi:MAG: hypothetical protein AAGN46_16115 [Acidobacteriota bacterium]